MSDILDYYQTIPELNIVGRMNTPEEFAKIGLPEKMLGQEVLDIGCNTGAFLLEAFKRGARRLIGIEPNLDWRLLAQGIFTELHLPLLQWDFKKDIAELDEDDQFDTVLLLSVTHVAEGMSGQDLLFKAEKLTRVGGLLIIEINDRLQKEPILLPEGSQKIGVNKDNRTVYHFRKV